MNRSDHWQNLAGSAFQDFPKCKGELLLTPGSTLTLLSVYHRAAKPFSVIGDNESRGFGTPLTQEGLPPSIVIG
jgi:hypothetical protein